MDISTGSWFKYLNENIRIDEGVRDIGLPEYVVDHIESALDKAGEKAKTFVGNEWKKDTEYQYARQERAFGLVDFIIDQYGNYIIKNYENAEELEQTGSIVAKTSEDNDKSEKVKFVIINIKNTLMKEPFGKWRKSFQKAIKALSKLGFDSEQVEKTQDMLVSNLQDAYDGWARRYSEVYAFLNDDPSNYELIKGESIYNAEGYATKYLANKEDPSQIIHTFDDGSYWYNLDTDSCDTEGERMGHCGSDSRGTLVSLRKKKSKRRESSSYVTMTYDKHYNTIHQIKGRNNDAPPEETWKNISWFIDNMSVQHVTETGEHSNDIYGFSQMNSALKETNPSVNFTGDIESMQERAEEMLEELNQNYEFDHSSVWAGDVQEYNGELYADASLDVSFEVPLGWKGFVKDSGYYAATIASTDPDVEGSTTEQDPNFLPIPQDGYNNDAIKFIEDALIGDVADELPGEEGENRYEVLMMKGLASSDRSIGDPNPPQTAHLIVNIIRTETIRVYSEGDEEPDVSDVEYFFEQTKSNFDDEYEHIVEKVRSALASEGYAERNAWDKERESVGDIEKSGLEHFAYHGMDAGAEFWFRNNEMNIDNTSDVKIPIDIPLYAWDGRDMRGIPSYLNDMFGSLKREIPGVAAGYSSDTLNRNMARQLKNLFGQEQKDPSQTQLPFGDEYKWQPMETILAKDLRFIVVPKLKYDTRFPEQLPNVTLQWRLTIGVNSKDSAEEIEIVKKIVKLLNDNPDVVVAAANKLIEISVEPAVEHAEKKKEAALNGSTAQTIIRSLDNTYAANAMNGDDTAERIIMIIKWINDSWEQMDEIERYVALMQWLVPMDKRTFRTFSNEGAIELEDNYNIGKPVMFDEKVNKELQRRGAAPSQLRNYAGGLSEQIENIEDQIARIDNMLQEKDPNYDLRIYSIVVDVAVSKGVGGEVQETQTEIRGIDGVTTVRTIGSLTSTGTTLTGKFEIKFEILGSMSRVRYRDRILVPGMMKVKGLRILRVSPIHRTNKQGTIRTVRENKRTLEEYGFGGSAAALSGIRSRGRTMPTPRKMLSNIAADWEDGGVMSYDAPMDTTDMRYHVMMPVEEILPYCSREFRAPKDAFDGMYQSFIKNGATSPVYIAVGKNGRVKVTGNEDLVWFAKKSGLQELPVFLSYQRQV